MIYNVYVYDSKEAVRDFVATFTSFAEAESFVINNETDIWETCYDKAMIYELVLGAHYGHAESHTIYQYSKKTNKYVKMKNQKAEYKKIIDALCKRGRK